MNRPEHNDGRFRIVTSEEEASFPVIRALTEARRLYARICVQEWLRRRKLIMKRGSDREAEGNRPKADDRDG